MSARTSIALALLLLASPSRAEDANIGLATDAFEAGLKKMETGRCEETPIGDRAVCTAARDDFRRAYELYPSGLGALRNLAFVEKGLGLVASSARHFRELARKAPLDPKPARRLWAEFAKKELEDLEPRVPRLTVKVAPGAPEGTRVLVDDVALPPSAWNTALELDPGPHAIRAEAEGHAPFRTSVVLAEKDATSVEVTFEEPQGAPPKAPPLPPKQPEGSPERDPRIAPLVVTGLGAATVAVGLGFGWAAIQKRKEVCTGPGCDPDAYADGKALARTSTIVTGVGLAAAASGIVWYVLTVPRDPERRTAIVPSAFAGGAGLQVVGLF
jgi:hypothetical protein